MCNAVAIPTYRRVAQHRFGVGLSMAVAALRDLSMYWMALSTWHSRMLGYIRLQHIVDVFVATSADERICVLRIGYHQRLVHGVAGHAILHRKVHLGAMGFVTRTAFGDEAMLVGVAVNTAHLGRMLAGVALQFLIDTLVAKGARGLGL